MSPTALPIDALHLDAGLQSRVKLDFPTIEHYAELMRDGACFPPVAVVYDGTEYYVRDGFHRVKAAKLAGFDQIAAEVENGTLTDAQWYAPAANKDHGLQRSRADLQRALEMALRHPRSAGLSDRAIAEHVGCTAPTVAAARKRLEATEKIYSDTVRVGRDGRQIETANIGKAAKADEPNATLVALYDQHEAYAGWVGEMNISIAGIGALMIAGHIVTCTRRGPSGGLMRWYQITPLGCEALGRPPLGFVPEPPANLYPGIDVVQGHVADRQVFSVGDLVETKAGVLGRVVTAPPNGDSVAVEGNFGVHWHKVVNLKRIVKGESPAAEPEKMPETMPVPEPEQRAKNAQVEPPARVAHFHQVADHWNALSEVWEDDQYVYIGRAVSRLGLSESPWHNPYKIVGADTPAARQQVIDLYRRHITPKVESGELDLEALRGKTLVCWCHPKACHGDVLVELLAAKDAAGARDDVPVALVPVTLLDNGALATSYLRALAKRLITPHVRAGRSVEWLVLAGADGHLDGMDKHTSFDYSFGGKLVVSAAETIKLRDRQLGIVMRHEVSGNTYRVYDVDELYTEAAAELKADTPEPPALPDVDEDVPPAPQEPGPLQTGDWVRTRASTEGQVVRIEGRFAIIQTRYARGSRHRIDSLTKIDLPADAAPMIVPAASVAPVVDPDYPGYGKAQAADGSWVMPRPAEKPYATAAGRVLAWLRETLRDDPADIERVLIQTDGTPVYAGDIRAAVDLLSRALAPAPAPQPEPEVETPAEMPAAVHWAPPVPWKPGRYDGSIEGADSAYVLSLANMVTNAGPADHLVRWIVDSVNARFPGDYNQPVTLDNAVVGESVYYFEHLQGGGYRWQWTKVTVTKVSEKRVQIQHPLTDRPTYVEPRSLCRNPFGVPLPAGAPAPTATPEPEPEAEHEAVL